MWKVHLVVCALLVWSVSAEKFRFDNFKLYKLKIDNDQQLAELQSIEESASYHFIDLPGKIGLNIRMLVPPGLQIEFEEMVDTFQFEVQLISDDFQKILDIESPPNRPKAMDWTSYKTLSEIYTWLDETAAAHSNVMKVSEIGSSYEGRPIKVVNISYKTGNRAIFIESNIHAREWITSATATWIINELLTSTDVEVRRIAENYDWYIVPVLNVDGFAYTHEVFRLWRKTRTPQANDCWGVDANRNFGYNWMKGGASSNPCSETFAGPSPYSEVEIQHLVDYYVTILDRVDVYLSFHSYSQFVLTPLGTTNEPVHNQDHLLQIGNAAATALAKRHGTQYTVGNWMDVLYLSSGISIDWAHAAAHTPIAYTLEFRDTGEYGFELPPSQIIPNAEEVLDSLVALIAEATKLGYLI